VRAPLNVPNGLFEIRIAMMMAYHLCAY
jgi:hypothetical protein